MKPYLIPILVGLSACLAAAQTATMLAQPSRLFRQGATPTADDKAWLRALIGLDSGNSPSFAAVTATTFTGNLTGNVTGNASGNAGTATKLATARNINGVAFDGTADITISGGGGGSITSNNITDSTAPGRAILTAATAKAQVTLLTTVTTNGNTSITLADSDSGTVILCTAGSAVTITVPSTLSAGFTAAVIQGGAGQVTFTAGSGATVGSYLNMLKTAGQNASASLLRVGSGAYHLSGNITP